MGMTSVVLIILAVSVRAVSWADATLRRRQAQKTTDDSAPAEEIVPTETEVEEEAPDPRARAAAIAVALALSKWDQADEMPAGPTATSAITGAVHDAWLTEGRARQRARRGTVRTAKGRR